MQSQGVACASPHGDVKSPGLVSTWGMSRACIPAVPRDAARRRAVSRWLRVVFSGLCAWWAGPGVVGASEHRASPWDEVGALERAMAERELGERALEPVHDPWGRQICGLHFAQLPIFLPEEPIPTLFNRLHVTTQTRVVQAALAFDEGDTWDALDVRDSERSLRDPNIYTCVTILPVRSLARDPDDPCVEALVVTRDLWSLRLAWNVQTAGSTVTSVYAGVLENNIAGTNATAGIDYERLLGQTRLGAVAYVPWLRGSRLFVSDRFELLFDRDMQRLEGTSNHFVLSRPLLSAGDRTGWSLEAYHRQEIARRFVGPDLRVATVDYDGQRYTFDEVWESTEVSAAATRLRSFGREVKLNVGFGAYLALQEHEPYRVAADVPQGAVERFRQERLPRSERGMGPTAQAELFENRYLTLVNYNTFALSEELRLGVRSMVYGAWSEPLVGASDRFLLGRAVFGYTLGLGTQAFVRAEFTPSARLQDRWVDITSEGELRFVSSPLVAGRAILRLRMRHIERDATNERVSFGADSALRGFRNGYLDSKNFLQYNAEWRSLPMALGNIRLGLVLFGDGVYTYSDGAASVGEDAAFAAAVGFGFRLVIPQLMANVRFLDVGFPLTDARPLRMFGWNSGIPAPVLSIGADQAF